jgi:hypothetical protein
MTRGATASGMISAPFKAPTALLTQPGEITTANGDQPKLTVCTGGKSHPQNSAIAEPAGPAH